MDPKKTLLIAFFIIFGASFVYLYVKQEMSPTINTNWNLNTNQTGTVTTSGDESVQRFDSYDNFQAFMADHAANDRFAFGVTNMMMVDAVMNPMVGDASLDNFAGLGGPAEESKSVDFSETNVQVEGVDEADIIKSDGSHLYIANNNTVVIVEAYPAETAKIVSKIELNSRVQSMYIKDGKLTVYGMDYRDLYEIQPVDDKVGISIVPINPSNKVFLKVYDVSDPSSPVISRDVTLEGYISSSRMVGDYVYMVTTKNDGYYNDGPYPMPRIWENGQLIAGDPSAASFRMPDIYYFPFIPYERPSLTSVSAVNIADDSEEINSDVYVFDANQNLYVSTNNMYITYVQRLNEQEIAFDISKEVMISRLSSEDQSRIKKIEASEDFILSKYEKQSKIMQIIARHTGSLPRTDQKQLQELMENKTRTEVRKRIDELERTIIHKIAISDGEMAYVADGEVPGHVINQFSMDEHDGNFRIATTRGQLWSQYIDDSERESYNNLYILDEDMKTVGSVERLAVGEQIYSVRFMQGRAYMVTFEQVDPLFVIDVEDPKNPTVLGELKIPGFSNYLHPYDETTLIGLGRDTKVENDRVRTQGIKISLFDVSDVKNPIEKTNFIIGGAGEYSPALSDHKAFLFSREKNLLAIPVRGDYFSIREFNPALVPLRDKEFITTNFDGVYVFNVTDELLELRGVVEHTPADTSSYYNNDVQRSLYIEDVLYSLSNLFLKAHKIDDLSEISSIDLPTNSYNYPEPIPFFGIEEPMIDIIR